MFFITSNIFEYLEEEVIVKVGEYLLLCGIITILVNFIISSLTWLLIL